MSRINREVADALIEARTVFARQPERVAFFVYDKDGFGVNARRIRFTVMKDAPNFGTGYSIYDGGVYLATFEDRVLDYLQVGIATASAPPKPEQKLNVPAN